MAVCARVVEVYVCPQLRYIERMLCMLCMLWIVCTSHRRQPSTRTFKGRSVALSFFPIFPSFSAFFTCTRVLDESDEVPYGTYDARQ